MASPFTTGQSSEASTASMSLSFPDLFVKCKSLHKVDVIITVGQKVNTKTFERCTFRGPRCTSAPVLYCCNLCSPASYMCKGCYSDEDKQLQALTFKTEVSILHQHNLSLTKVLLSSIGFEAA